VPSRNSSKVLADGFPYLVIPVESIVVGFRVPVVQMMSDAAIPEHFEHSMNRPAVLPGLSRQKTTTE
jgi:hypothetical protein